MLRPTASETASATCLDRLLEHQIATYARSAEFQLDNEARRNRIVDKVMSDLQPGEGETRKSHVSVDRPLSPLLSIPLRSCCGCGLLAADIPFRCDFHPRQPDVIDCLPMFVTVVALPLGTRPYLVMSG